MSFRSEVKTNMLEKALQVFLGLQIVLTATAVTYEESSRQVIGNAGSKEEGGVNGDKEQLNDGVNDNKPLYKDEQLNETSEENEQLNGADEENEKLNKASEENAQVTDEDKNLQLNDKIPPSEPQDLKIPLYKKWEKKEIINKPWEFKYSVDKREEPGFDLTSEEMKKFKIWKDGVIPYYIDVVSFSDKVLRDKIRNFLQMVNSVTSINFVEIPGPPSNDNDRWVFFMNRRGLLGCADHTVKNFTNQGVQQVVLGYDCIATRGEIAEAVMSILGVPAQHNAPDRDKYIKVNMENVMTDKKHLFENLNDNEWLFHDLAYDFDSVTHYDIHKYSTNGRATIELKKTSEDLNPATVFSTTDLLKIKMLYNFITRNKKMQAPVCEKLFKISSKFEPGAPLSKRSKPRTKPRRYLGISSKLEEENLNDHNSENNDNNGNEKEHTDDVKPKDINTVIEDEEIAGNGKTIDKNSGEKKMRPKRPLKGRGNPKHQRDQGQVKQKNREKARHVVDLLHQLSDYHTDNDYKRERMKFNTELKNDPLLELSDYQTAEDGKEQ